LHRLALLLLIALPASDAGAQNIYAVLDTIQHTAFNFFWMEANPNNGLIRDRGSVSGTSGAPASIASVGFGLSAICIGVDHGWVSRAAAKDRVLTTLKTFWSGPQGSGDAYIGCYGLFYHFLDMTTARRTWKSELSTIDTGLLLAGILDAQMYFDQTDPTEQQIRAYADSIYRRMNWDLMRNFNTGILMGWMPGSGFLNYGEWLGYNEASIMYVQALGSPSYPVDASAWDRWTQTYQWSTQYGYTYVNFPPLFGHQYSQCWLDMRGIRDAYMSSVGIDYFENSRRATYAQRAYCIANPGGHAGYSDSLWGITASDVPNGYAARGAPPAQDDDGTITPTAPISSLPFAPEIIIPVIRNLWNNYRDKTWTKYGFRDAFNLDKNWYDGDVIGIDQGPIIIMIENYLNGKVWKRFMKNPAIQAGLQAAGFIPVTGVAEASVPALMKLEQNFPNPFNPTTRIAYVVPAAAGSGLQAAGSEKTAGSGLQAAGSQVRLVIYDVLGRQVAVLVDGVQSPGRHEVVFDAHGLASGVYVYRMTAGNYVATRTMALVR
jgi:hypothetical protein